MRIYVAEDIKKYMLTMESIVNIMTIFPFLVISYTIKEPQDNWRFFVRMLDLLRMHLLLRIALYIENDLTRALIKIMIAGRCYRYIQINHSLF